MRVGVIANPLAGRGGRLESALRQMAPALAGHSLLTVQGFGAGCLPGEHTLPEPESTAHVARIQAAARALAAEEPDLLVVLGGDGMAAYVADALLAGGDAPPPLLGVAMGTANVGPIITLDLNRQPLEDLDALVYSHCGAVRALENGRHIAWGFNDVVLGNTLLATVNGHMACVDAALLAAGGGLHPARPMAEISRGLRVRKNGAEVPLTTRCPAQVVVSGLENDAFYGRAVTGALCFAPHSENRAAIALFPRPVVSMEADAADAFFPAEHLLFSVRDELEVANLDPGVCVVVDGNPYPQASGRVTFRYSPRLITVAALPPQPVIK